jgi:uncharacterized protein (TIGR01244 family)
MLNMRMSLILVALAALAANAQAPDPTDGLMNGAQPLPGITTAGQPDEKSLENLSHAGYVAVIDLRTPEEERGFDEKAAVESRGMKYISLPIGGASGVTYENASLLDETLSKIDGPVLVHCASSNRVGALLSLREKMHGASTEEALSLGDEAGLSSLRKTVEARLSEQ